MTDAINANNRINPATQPGDSRSKPAGQNKAEAAASAPASAVVELSSEQLLQQAQEAPQVDSNRIEQIKQAIANGDYKPNPEVIAQKFAEIEKLLP